ncbi:MAG TPA: hypothetical protein VIM29_00170 [Bacillota bacterium]
MINITLSASTNKELTAMIETLKKEGLINRLSIVEPEEVNAPVKQPAQPQQPAQPVNVAPVQTQQPLFNIGHNPTTSGDLIIGQVAQPAPPQPMQPVNVTPVQPQPVQPQPAQPLPTTAPSYTLEQLSLAAARGLMDTGRQTELMQLLAKYGIQALTQLPKEQYGAFATDLRAMGCKI